MASIPSCAFGSRRPSEASVCASCGLRSLAPNKLRISKNTAELPAVDAWKELSLGVGYLDSRTDMGACGFYRHHEPHCMDEAT